MESLKACAAEGMGPRGERGAEKSGSKKSGTEKSGAQGSGVAASVCPLLGSELLLKAEFRAKVDVTCPVCLEVPFDPVSLACTHIFCRGCACSVAHVPVFFGLDSASPHITCPLCRQQGVFRHPRSLRELHRLIMASHGFPWTRDLCCILHCMQSGEGPEQQPEQERSQGVWCGSLLLSLLSKLPASHGFPWTRDLCCILHGRQSGDGPEQPQEW
ncbi:unnamed protein product [Closterium sp. Naga37s-1]|nr:unnamed protein product [Closterium sp. Naga37s-1]CAI5525300.1 unnamed protein product [Closterium sp. Naga37s-1]